MERLYVLFRRGIAKVKSQKSKVKSEIPAVTEFENFAMS